MNNAEDKRPAGLESFAHMSVRKYRESGQVSFTGDVHSPLLPPESIRPLKILLITPQGRKDEDTNQKALFAMGVGVLVSITPPQHHIELADELFGDPIHYNGDYDMVGITTRTVNANRAYEIADEFLRRGKTKVILGGVHASFNYEEAREHCHCVVRGEAENMWATVLQDIAHGTLKPRYDSRDFPPVTEAPMLDYERIFNASRRGKVGAGKSIPIYMTRGCPYHCSFCVTPNFTGKLYRMQSAEAVRQQIEQAKRVFFKKTWYGDKPWFMFTDENFGVNKKRMYEILEVLKESSIKFSTFISLNFLEDPKTVQLMVEAGCAMALVGFESINDETLKTYGKDKQNSSAKYAKVIEQCRKAGLNLQGNFLANPAIDSYEDLAAVAQFVKENHLMMPLYMIITPYPGTELYWDYKEKNLLVDEDWDKYTSHNLVVRSERYEPMDYQMHYIRAFREMYTWPTIINRVLHNRNKFINLVTSVFLRRNLVDQIKSIESGKRRPIAQPPQSSTEPVPHGH